MINYYNIDITTVDRGVIMHGVNCQNKMNSGVARAIRDRWPPVYEKFMKTNGAEVTLGDVYFVELHNIYYNLYVANCYTQRYYGKDGKKYASPVAIAICLTKVAKVCNNLKLPLWMPKIGCGLGGLNWETDVKPLLEDIDQNYYPDVEFGVCCG